MKAHLKLSFVRDKYIPLKREYIQSLNGRSNVQLMVAKYGVYPQIYTNYYGISKTRKKIIISCNFSTLFYTLISSNTTLRYMFAQWRKDGRTNANHYYVTPSLRGEGKKGIRVVDKQKDFISGRSSGLHLHQFISHVSLYCVKYYLYLCMCYFCWHYCVLFVGREQSISCDNFLSNPIAVLFAIK